MFVNKFMFINVVLCKSNWSIIFNKLCDANVFCDVCNSKNRNNNHAMYESLIMPVIGLICMTADS